MKEPVTYRTVSIHVFLTVLAVLCLLPMVIVISVSFSSESDIIRNGYAVFPREFSVDAYRHMFATPDQILRSYSVSLFVTAIGTSAALAVSAMVAYVTTRRDFRASGPITFAVFLPLLFQAGLVPFYIFVVRTLGLKDTIAILVLPYLVTPWLVLLLRGYMKQVPRSVLESGWLDGAGEVRVFFSIVVPMSKSGLATVGLFYLFLYWNDWWLSLLFITEASKIPLQLLLQRILANTEFMRSALFQASGVQVDLGNLPGETARMATALIVAGPILIAFPFLQRYLVRGIAVGSLKG